MSYTEQEKVYSSQINIEQMQLIAKIKELELENDH